MNETPNYNLEEHVALVGRIAAQVELLLLSDEALMLIQDLTRQQYKLGFEYGKQIESSRAGRGPYRADSIPPDADNLAVVLRGMTAEEFRQGLKHRYENENKKSNPATTSTAAAADPG